MFSCAFCTKTLESRRNLNVHILSHTKEKPHKCLICAATFGTEGNLKKHIIGVHDGVKDIKKRNTHCPLCSYKCYSKVYLAIHMRKHTAEQPFSCSFPSCGFKTKYEMSVQQHYRNIHSAERPFECPSDGCTYKTKIKYSLQRHLKRHSSLKVFKCKVPGCNYSSNLWGNLKSHSCTSEKKPWKCSVCDFRSKQKFSLVKHEDTHKEIKRFRGPATNCGFSGSRKTTLDLHLDLKHRKKDVRRTTDDVNTLNCRFPDCRYQTKFPHHYDRHIATHNKKESRNHVCTFCFSKFSYLYLLKSHVQRHIGEKPYRCSHCQYAAVSNADLTAHATRVHQIYVNSRVQEDKLMKCRRCNGSFWSYNELVLHSMSHLQAVVLEQLKLQIM